MAGKIDSRKAGFDETALEGASLTVDGSMANVVQRIDNKDKVVASVAMDRKIDNKQVVTVTMPFDKPANGFTGVRVMTTFATDREPETVVVPMKGKQPLMKDGKPVQAEVYGNTIKFDEGSYLRTIPLSADFKDKGTFAVQAALRWGMRNGSDISTLSKKRADAVIAVNRRAAGCVVAAKKIGQTADGRSVERPAFEAPCKSVVRQPHPSASR